MQSWARLSGGKCYKTLGSIPFLGTLILTSLVDPLRIFVCVCVCGGCFVILDEPEK